MEFDYIAFWVGDVAPPDLATIRCLERNDVAYSLATGVKDGIACRSDVINRKGDVSKAWPIDGCRSTPLENVVVEDLLGWRRILVSGEAHVDSRQASASKARRGVEATSSEVPFRRHRDAAEDLLIEPGEGSPVLCDEVRVDIPG